MRGISRSRGAPRVPVGANAGAGSTTSGTDALVFIVMQSAAKSAEADLRDVLSSMQKTNAAGKTRSHSC